MDIIDNDLLYFYNVHHVCMFSFIPMSPGGSTSPFKTSHPGFYGAAKSFYFICKHIKDDCKLRDHILLKCIRDKMWRLKANSRSKRQRQTAQRPLSLHRSWTVTLKNTKWKRVQKLHLSRPFCGSVSLKQRNNTSSAWTGTKYIYFSTLLK